VEENGGAREESEEVMVKNVFFCYGRKINVLTEVERGKKR